MKRSLSECNVIESYPEGTGHVRILVSHKFDGQPKHETVRSWFLEKIEDYMAGAVPLPTSEADVLVIHWLRRESPSVYRFDEDIHAWLKDLLQKLNCETITSHSVKHSYQGTDDFRRVTDVEIAWWTDWYPPNREIAALCEIEDWWTPQSRPEATPHYPGTQGKVEILRQRLKAGQELFDMEDAGMDRPMEEALSTVFRQTRQLVQVPRGYAYR